MSGGGNIKNKFLDDKFTIQDDGDKTKQLTFEIENITTGTTRTITMPDSDVNLSSSGGTFQAANSNLTDLASLTPSLANIIVGDGNNWVQESGATARTSLGLGSIAIQNSSSVSISGGSITGITDIEVTDGGTGRSSALAYSVICGGTTNTSPHQSINSLGSSGQVLTSQGSGQLPHWTTVSCTGDVVGPAGATNNHVCTFDTATGKLIQDSGVDISNVLVSSDIGTSVQAYDAGLADIAALAVTDGNIIVGDGMNWVAESGATARTSLGLGSIATQASSSVTITGGSITGITDLAIADGGTGAGTATAAFDNLSPVTTKGDIIVRDSTNNIRLAVGSNNQVLTADSAQASGIKWATPSSGGITWNEVTGTSQSASVNNGYICNNAGLVTVTIPSTASIGDIVAVTGKGAGGWKIAQNASQTIYFVGSSTTTGTGGSVSSTEQYDCAELLCITANNDWIIRSSIGNLTIV